MTQAACNPALQARLSIRSANCSLVANWTSGGIPAASAASRRRSTPWAGTVRGPAARARGGRRTPGRRRSDSSRSGPPCRSTARCTPADLAPFFKNPVSSTTITPRGSPVPVDVGGQVVADQVRVPVGAAEQALDAVRRFVAGLLGELPAVLPRGVGEQAAQVGDGSAPRLDSEKRRLNRVLRPPTRRPNRVRP